MVHTRRSIVVLLCVAVLATARAASFPDAWQGDVILSNVMAPQSVGGGRATISITESGTIPLSVANAKVTGEADVPYANDVAAGGCTMAVRGAMHVTMTGDVTGAGQVGAGLDLSFKSAPVKIAGTIKCPGKPDVNFPVAPQPAAGGQVKVPIADGAGGGNTFKFGATMNSSVKLVTPCAKWDSRKPAGPVVEFLPSDPRAGNPPAWKPDYSKNIDALTMLARNQPAPPPGTIARIIGLTVLPGKGGFMNLAELASSTPRKRIYKSCDWADRVRVVILFDQIPSYVSQEVGALKVGDACRAFVEQHEAHHFAIDQATMRKIATEVEAKLKTDVPGPNNAEPNPLPTGGALLKVRIDRIVTDIVDSNYEANQAQSRALDVAEYPRIQEICKGVLSKH